MKKADVGYLVRGDVMRPLKVLIFIRILGYCQNPLWTRDTNCITLKGCEILKVPWKDFYLMCTRMLVICQSP